MALFLNINSTYETPKITFNTELFEISIEGVSLPIVAFEFYSDLIELMKTELIKKPKKITFNCNLSFFNTGTSRCLLIILNLIMRFCENNPDCNAVINWHYEDEDILECGLDYEYMTSLKFNFIKIEN